MDLEIAFDHDPDDQKNILGRLNADLCEQGIPLTVFTTSNAAAEFKHEIKKLSTCGNEIACHGFDHNMYENYRTMGIKETEDNIYRSTYRIENIIQNKVYSFRGPGFSTSSAAQEILLKNGYRNDLSVCSQRIDFMNSAGGTYKWLISPRRPYHPSKNNPYKKGTLPLWVIPLSSLGVPFISGLLYLFGLEFMKYYYRMLLAEARRTGKPIVYLFHSYEFGRIRDMNCKDEVSNNQIPQKWFHKYYGNDIYQKYYNNLNLIRYIFSFRDTKAFTAKSYSEYLDSIN